MSILSVGEIFVFEMIEMSVTVKIWYALIMMMISSSMNQRRLVSRSLSHITSSSHCRVTRPGRCHFINCITPISQIDQDKELLNHQLANSRITLFSSLSDPFPDDLLSWSERDLLGYLQRIKTKDIKLLLQRFNISSAGIFDRSAAREAILNSFRSRRIDSAQSSPINNRKRDIIVENIINEMKIIEKWSDVDIYHELRSRGIDFDSLKDERKRLVYLLARHRHGDNDLSQASYDNMATSSKSSTSGGFMYEGSFRVVDELTEGFRQEVVAIKDRFVNESMMQISDTISSLIKPVIENVVPLSTNQQAFNPAQDQKFEIQSRMDRIVSITIDMLRKDNITDIPPANTLTYDCLKTTKIAISKKIETLFSKEQLVEILRLRGLLGKSEFLMEIDILPTLVDSIIEEAVISLKNEKQKKILKKVRIMESIQAIKDFYEDPKGEGLGLEEEADDATWKVKINKWNPISSTDRKEMSDVKMSEEWKSFGKKEEESNMVTNNVNHHINKSFFSLFQHLFHQFETILMRFTRWCCGEYLHPRSSALIIAIATILLRKGIGGFVGIMLSIRLLRLLISTRTQM